MCFYSDTLTLSQIDGFSGRAEINNKMLLKCLRITPLWGKDCIGILLSTFCFLTVLILHMTATMWLWPLSFQFPIFNTAVSLRGREKHFTNVCIVLAIQNDSHIAFSCKTKTMTRRMSSHHNLALSYFLKLVLTTYQTGTVTDPIKFHMSVINQKFFTKSFTFSS